MVQGNVLVAGPTTPGNNGYVPPEFPGSGDVALVRVDQTIHPQSSIYLDGNYYDRHCGGSACLASPAAQWRLAWDGVGGSIRASTPPLALDNLPLWSALPASQVEGYLTAERRCPSSRSRCGRCAYRLRDCDSNRKCAEHASRKSRRRNGRRRLSGSGRQLPGVECSCRSKWRDRFSGPHSYRGVAGGVRSRVGAGASRSQPPPPPPRAACRRRDLHASCSDRARRLVQVGAVILPAARPAHVTHCLLAPHLQGLTTSRQDRGSKNIAQQFGRIMRSRDDSVHASIHPLRDSASLPRRWRVCAVATVAALVLSQGILDGQRVIDYGGYRPHYQGYGVNTPGGRGGEVCRVNSLSDTAWPPVPGTLRYCVEASTGPRFVIFEISGTIRLVRGPLFVRNPYITIAGQTAPSPGILIRGPGVIIDTHDVVAQHLRIRVGSIPSEPHALWIRDGARNIVIDHVSLSWSVWTSVGIYLPTAITTASDITIMDSIVAEALACSGVNSVIPCDPAWYPTIGFSNSRAMLIRKAAGVTLVRNVFAQHQRSASRNGWSHSDDSRQQHDLQPVADAVVRRVVRGSAS